MHYQRQRDADPEYRKKVNAKNNEWYHRAGGGYSQRRLRDLTEQKATILTKLAEVQQLKEAILSESQR